MIRPAAWLMSFLLLTAPLSALAGEAGAAADLQDYISSVTGDLDQNPHSCYEAEEEQQDKPDLASRPQS